MSLRIRKAARADVPAVVGVHLSAFDGYFLTLMGRQFLNLLYESYVADQDAVLMVAALDSDRSVVGLLAGVRAPDRFFRNIRRQKGIWFGMAALRALMREPVRVGGRLVAAVRYRGDRPQRLSGYWLLSSLGVQQEFSGRGIGGKLLGEFVDMARAEGADGIYLITDERGNDAAIGFYANHGFSTYSSFARRDGRQLLVLARSFSR